jgi:hypothetical protein
MLLKARLEGGVSCVVKGRVWLGRSKHSSGRELYIYMTSAWLFFLRVVGMS